MKIANINKEDIFINSYYPLPGYILIIVGTLIYNEILIFYFCNFEYNTKKEITLRAENDVNNTIDRNKAGTMKSEDIEIGEVQEDTELSLILTLQIAIYVKYKHIYTYNNENSLF